MTSGRSNLIEVAADFRRDTDRGIAIWDGDRDEAGREVWTWLPKKLVENNGDGTFTMPEWLARDKGLI